MKKIGLFIISLILLTPLSVQAQCSTAEIVRLQKIAGNVNFKVDYTENYPIVKFHITISNMHPDIKIFDIHKGEIYTYGMDPANPSEITIYNYDEDRTLEYIIYSTYASCPDEIVFKNYVTLPFYNHYYKNEQCQGLQGYKLCQKWEKNELNYAEFTETITEYKNSHKIPDSTEQKNDGKTYDKIIEFVAKYYLIILIPIIVICGGLIIYIDKKDGL